MAFENSPKIDSPHSQKPSTFIDWMILNRRKVYLSVIVLLIVWIAFVLIVYISIPKYTAADFGGLDGYVLSSVGKPISALITVGDKQADTYADGYFFFEDIPAGEYRLTVSGDTGSIDQNVIITKGEVTELGKLVIE